MTFNFKNVYLDETATITGPYEAKGPLANFFDKTVNNLYFETPTFEQAEIKMQKEVLDNL